MTSLSVIVTACGQIEYSRLFLESLQGTTRSPYELIVIDNGMPDGCRTLFEQHGATLVRNESRLCRACSNNLGLQRAHAAVVAFVEDDIYLSRDWDKRLIDHINDFGLDAVSPCGIEAMEDEAAGRRAIRKWQRISAGGPTVATSLRRCVGRMYGDWDDFTDWPQVVSILSFH